MGLNYYKLIRPRCDRTIYRVLFYFPLKQSSTVRKKFITEWRPLKNTNQVKWGTPMMFWKQLSVADKSFWLLSKSQIKLSSDVIYIDPISINQSQHK